MKVNTKQVYCAKVQTGWMEIDFSLLIMKGMYMDGTLLMLGFVQTGSGLLELV